MSSNEAVRKVGWSKKWLVKLGGQEYLVEEVHDDFIQNHEINVYEVKETLEPVEDPSIRKEIIELVRDYEQFDPF